MANYIVSDTDMKTVADAIRQKSGSSETMTFPAEFASQIQSIPTGDGGETFMSATLDLSTMLLSNFSMGYDDIVTAHGNNKVVKCNISYYSPTGRLETTIADLRTVNESSGGEYVSFDALMHANLGDGNALYMFRFELVPDLDIASDTVSVDVFKIQTTAVN